MENNATNEASQDKNDIENTTNIKELAEAHIDSTQNMFDNSCRSFEEYSKVEAFQKYKDCFANADGAIEEIIVKF